MANEKWVAENKDFYGGEEPKILIADIEVTAILAWTYQAYNGNIIKIEQDPKMVSIAWQWLGEKKIHCKTLADYGGVKDRFNIDDKKLVREFYDVLQEATHVVGHNWDAFDMKTLNARLLYHGFEPPPHQKTIDTLKVARKYFKMPKNNLDEIYRYIFKKEGKTKVKHSDVIWDCLDNDAKAFNALKKYNIRDVEITREVYLKVRPFHKTHPNLTLYTRRPHECKVCGHKKLTRRGSRWYSRTGFRFLYRCESPKCGTEFPYGPAFKDIEKVESY